MISFDNHTDTDTGFSIIWGVFKAYIRGLCMAKPFSVRRLLLWEQRALEDKIGKLERTLSQNVDINITQEITELKTDYHKVSDRLSKMDCHAYKARLYNEDKAGHMTAWLVNRETKSHPIEGIQLPDDTMVTGQNEINQAFLDYYKLLYAQTLQPTPRTL